MSAPANLAQLRAQARTQAYAMLDALEAHVPGLARQLQADPMTGLRQVPDVELELVRALDGSGCDVSGDYDGKRDPKLIKIVQGYERMMAFTGLHELGHHLTRSVSEDLFLSVYAHAERDQFEELSCEAFAALVLLPDDLVTEVLPVKGASAETIKTFFELSQASRRACCVRASTTLVGGGVVAAYDGDGIVQFAASTAPGIFPPARGSDQSGAPLIQRALGRKSATVEHDQTFISYSTHDGADVLYGQATWIDGWIVAVMKPDNVSWRDFAPPQGKRQRPAREPSTPRGPAPATRPFPTSRWATCETCQDTFEVEPGTAPCATCGEPKCDKGHCRCTAHREITCRQCWLKKDRVQFTDPGAAEPVCKECRDG